MSTLLHASCSHHNDLPVRLQTCQLHKSLSTCRSLQGGLPADHLDLLSVCHCKRLKPFSVMKQAQAPSTCHCFHPLYFISTKSSPLHDATVLCSSSVSNFLHSDSPHQPVRSSCWLLLQLGMCVLSWFTLATSLILVLLPPSSAL